MAKVTFDEAKSKLDDPYACFNLINAQKRIALSPKYIGNIKIGIIEQLGAETKLYSEELDGVPVAYNNIKVKQEYASILEEQPYLHFALEADFIVFKPTINNILKGIVNKIGKDHIGCLIHGCFNGSIHKHRSAGDEWPGAKSAIGDEIVFKVTRLFTQNGILSIIGKITEENDKAADKSKRRSFALTQSSREAEATTVVNGDITELSLSPSKKRKRKSNSFVENGIEDELPEIKHKKKKRKKDKINDMEELNGETKDSFELPEPVELNKHKKVKKHSIEKINEGDNKVFNESSELAFTSVEENGHKSKHKKKKKKKSIDKRDI